MNRCLNDVFAYCRTNPKPVEAQVDEVTFDYRGKEHHELIPVIRCSESCLTCPDYLSLTQSLDLQLNSAREV